MKKLFIFLLTFCALAIMVFGMTGTGAWFTSTKTITGNSISSGTFDLLVEGGGIQARHMEPGGDWRDVGWFCAINNGDYDMKWRGWINSVEDPQNLRHFLHIRLVLNPLDHQGNYAPVDTIIYDDILFVDLISPENPYLLMDDTTVLPGAPTFAPQSKVCYGIQARLDSEAGNSQLNATLTANLHLTGTQWYAPW